MGQMKRAFEVICDCGENHSTEEVEFLNVEEDIQGRDILTFRCPKTEEVVQSPVRLGAYNV